MAKQDTEAVTSAFRDVFRELKEELEDVQESGDTDTTLERRTIDHAMRILLDALEEEDDSPGLGDDMPAVAQG